jgi:Flp pilus assembly protein TadG
MNRQRALGIPQPRGLAQTREESFFEGAMNSFMNHGPISGLLSFLRMKLTDAARFLGGCISPPIFPALVCRFARQNRATAIMEFGLLAAPVVAGLIAILQTSLVFFAGQSLETAAATSARLVMTGQAQLAGWSPSDFKQQVCNQIHGIFNCTTGIYVDVETYSSFASVNLGMPIQGGAFNSSSLGYNPGGPGDIVVLRLYYQFPVFGNLLGFNLSNVNGGYDLLAATAVFKNEPYASTASSS